MSMNFSTFSSKVRKFTQFHGSVHIYVPKVKVGTGEKSQNFLILNKIRITVKTFDVLDITLHIKVTVCSLSKIFDKEKGKVTCNNRLLVNVLAKGILAQVILI